MEDLEFSKKLTEVFAFLPQLESPVTDDTCLQRLQDILIEKFSDDECPGLEQFLVTVSERLDDVEPSVVAFSLHLCSLTITNGDLSLGAIKLLDTINEKDFWEKPSVGTAYFDILTVIAKLQHGWKWMLERKLDFFSQALSSLQERKTIFLHASARRLLVTVYDNYYQDINSRNLAVSSTAELLHRLLEDFVRELNSAASIPRRDLNVYLQNLMIVLSATKQLILEADEKEMQKIMHDLLYICLTCQSGSSTLCEDLLIHWLVLMSKRDSSSVITFLEKEFLFVCNNELEDIDIVKLHKLAAVLQQSFVELDVSAALEDVVMTPYWILLEETSGTLSVKCRKAFQVAMKTTNKRLRLMLQTTNWIAIKKKTDLLIKVLEYISCDKTGNSPSGQSGHAHTDPRLQISLFEGINKLVHSDFDIPVSRVLKTVDVILEITTGINTHNGVLEKGLDCVTTLLRWVACSPNGSEYLNSYLPLVANHLERHLVGTKWEHRDTAVEAVTKLVILLKDIPEAVSVMSSTKVLVSAWQCVIDSESYVRASAAQIIDKVVRLSNIWEMFLLQLGLSEEDVVGKLEDIVCTDTEAFPRRAAVLSLLAVYIHRPCTTSVKEKIMSTMTKAMSDFDWEVKANALEFWQLVCDQHISMMSAADLSPSDTAGNESTSYSDKLRKTGLFNALCYGIDDYDQHVCEKTYQILNSFKQKLNVRNLNELMKSQSQNGQGESAVDGETLEESEHCGTDSFQTVVRVLRETDIDVKLAVLSGSVDEYSRNPIALLEDILSEGKDTEDDKFVDCY